jgi:hypothetical protein
LDRGHLTEYRRFALSRDPVGGVQRQQHADCVADDEDYYQGFAGELYKGLEGDFKPSGGEKEDMTNRLVTIQTICDSDIRYRRDAERLHGISDCGPDPVCLIRDA